MSGPPYPHPNPAPGSNSIGKFKIGISPVGDIAPFDPWLTVLSQYANSPVITGMITAFNAAMDFTQMLDQFYDMMWNIFTAQGYGLDVWGRIVGVSRTISIPGSVQYLGFEEAGASWTGFGPAAGQGIFFSGGLLTTNFVLQDSDFRRLILAKAASNVSDGSIHSVNSILLALFPGRGVCYVQDNQNMTLTYVFKFALAPVEVAIVSQLNVLPSAAGVAITVAHF